jgi:hypothetical protein
MLTPESKYFSGKFKIKSTELSSITKVSSNDISISCTISP